LGEVWRGLKNKQMKNGIIIVLVFVFSTTNCVQAQTVTEVGLYLTFEQSLENDKAYTNKFNDVELMCTYTSPSGIITKFPGFF